METYIIKGNHPVFKRIDLVVNDKDNLHQKMDELLTNGYEVTIELQTTKHPDTTSSMGDILRSAMGRTEGDLLKSPTNDVLGPVLKTLEE